MKHLFTCLFAGFMVLLALLLHSSSAFSQGVSSDGRDFYLGFLAPSHNTVITPDIAKFFHIYALVSSFEDNTVQVSYFDPVTGVETLPVSYTISGRQSTQIELDSARMRMTNPGDLIKEYRSCHITSKKPIEVHFFSVGACAGGSYMALPKAVLGKKYVVESYADNLYGEGGLQPKEASAGCFLIIGTFDNTLVKIIPNSTTAGGEHTGVHYGKGHDYKEHPYFINVNRGQCYFVKSLSDFENQNSDISGSIVESDKPIALIAGHENAFTYADIPKRNLESRDVMVEQMIPVEYWDTTGYVSIPLKDSQPFDSQHGSGPGELCRFFTYDSAGSQIGLDASSKSYVGISRFNPWDRPAHDPINAFSADKHKFSVMMYDYSDIGKDSPFPAPSMMTIIPKSHWKKSFVWSVPPNKLDTLQSYYINVVGNAADIKISINGGSLKPITAQLTLDKWWNGYGGWRYRVFPGSFYAKSDYPFMIYNYGFRGFATDDSLGDFKTDNFFFSYADPVGMSTVSGNTANISITTDTSCGRLHLCVTDERAGGGIRTISLIDDLAQNIIPAGSNQTPYKFNNCVLSTSQNTSESLEIDYTGNEKAVCFDVALNDPSYSGYAPILIVDNSGNTFIYETNIARSNQLYSTLGTLDFAYPRFDSRSDTTISFTSSPSAKKDLVISGIRLSHQDPSLQIDSIRPDLPALLKPGGSMKIFAHFSVTDTISHADTIMFVTSCPHVTIPIAAIAGYPIINASDIDFGEVFLGKKICKTLLITNPGKYSFTLGKDFLITGNADFSIDPASQALLPVVIAPGGSLTINVCYAPTNFSDSSGKIIWSTDIAPNVEKFGKDSSHIRGKAIAFVFLWDRRRQNFIADSTRQVIQRIYLMNHFNQKLLVERVRISGIDADEFSIVRSENGQTADFTIDAEDSVWFDVGFKRDMAKTPAFRLRSAMLIAENTTNGIADTVWMDASFGTSSVAEIADNLDMTLTPNPVNKGSLKVTLGLQNPGKVSIEIYDLHGRKLHEESFTSRNEFTVNVSDLSAGIYYLHLETDGKLISRQFEMLK